jgi:hypothetical protein
MTDNQLIFLISTPRSGSTFLQALLSNNEFVNTTSEPWLMLPFVSYLRSDLKKERYDEKLCNEGISFFLEKLGGQPKFESLLRSFLLDAISPLVNEQQLFLDKTIRYYLILDDLKRIFPEAKFIILKRNPLANLNSMISWQGAKTYHDMYWYYDDLIKAPCIMDDFLKRNKDNKNVKEVVYENLVAQPEKELKELYNFMNVPFSEKVMDYSGNNKFRGELGDTKVLSKGTIYKADLNKWQEKLNDKNWKSFFTGYVSFLGEDFIKDYAGNAISFDIKDTKDFNRFLKYGALNFNRFEIEKANLIDYLKFRIISNFKL